MGKAKSGAKRARRKPAKEQAPKVQIKKDRKEDLESKALRETGVRLLNLSADGVSSRIRQFVSTGSVALDILIGGGIPTGRIVELYGPPHIGKSTLLDSIFAAVQRQGGVAILADTESSRSVDYTHAIGVDVGALEVMDFEDHISMEKVLSAIQKIVRHRKKEMPDKPIVIGWDSLAKTQTEEEFEKGIGASMVAPAAKILSGAWRQLMSDLAGSNVGLVVVNHQYQLINATGYGPRKATYGGDGLRFASSLRLDMRPAGWIKDSQGVVFGQAVNVKVEKDKVNSNSWLEAKIAIIKGSGIDNAWSLNEMLVEYGLAVRAGSWTAVNLDGQDLKWQGYSGFLQKIREDPTIFDRLVSCVKATAEQSKKAQLCPSTLTSAQTAE